MSKEVTEVEFNKYCAGVVGYAVGDTRSFLAPSIQVTDSDGFGIDYDPHNDLNQITKAVEKLLDKDFMLAIDKLNMYLQEGHSVNIKQAFRDFIISTMENNNENSD